MSCYQVSSWLDFGGGIYKIAGLEGLRVKYKDKKIKIFDVNVKDLNQVELENARDIVKWYIAIMVNLMQIVM